MLLELLLKYWSSEGKYVLVRLQSGEVVVILTVLQLVLSETNNMDL